MQTSQGGATDVIPGAIFFDDNLLTVDTQPHTNLLACGTVQGDVKIFEYCSEKESKLMKTLNITKEPCRSVRFSKSGKCLYCAGKDKSLYIVDTETLKIIKNERNAHSSPLNALHTISERLITTGDENGCVKVWDTRVNKSVFCINENTDFISNFISTDNSLLCTSGDGSLTAIDLRQHKLDQRSDPSESELLCLAIVKGGKRVVCGDGEGVLGVFAWGLWGDVIDRYPINARSNSVDAIIQISDSVVCTGGMDGYLRAIQILPNKVIGTVGFHSEDYSVDGLCLTHEGQYLLSSSYDSVKFWSTDEIPTVWIKDEVEDETKERKRGRKRKKGKRRKELSQTKKHKKDDSNFFADL